MTRTLEDRFDHQIKTAVKELIQGYDSPEEAVKDFRRNRIPMAVALLDRAECYMNVEQLMTGDIL